jgi:hypothetical protein
MSTTDWFCRTKVVLFSGLRTPSVHEMENMARLFGYNLHFLSRVVGSDGDEGLALLGE